MANTRGSYGTAEFRLGAFSEGEGYPHVAQIYQQRMVMAATNVQPSTIWLSETANFYSFSPSVISEQGSPESITEGVSKEIVIDSNALTFTLDSDTLDEIKWLGESKKLSMGTLPVYICYMDQKLILVLHHSGLQLTGKHHFLQLILHQLLFPMHCYIHRLEEKMFKHLN